MNGKDYIHEGNFLRCTRVFIRFVFPYFVNFYPSSLRTQHGFFRPFMDFRVSKGAKVPRVRGGPCRSRVLQVPSMFIGGATPKVAVHLTYFHGAVAKRISGMPLLPFFSATYVSSKLCDMMISNSHFSQFATSMNGLSRAAWEISREEFSRV